MLRKTFLEIFLVFLITTLIPALSTQQLEEIMGIYIRADGSIDPPTAPIKTLDNITYTLTNNVYGLIVVERNNIIIDGAGSIILHSLIFMEVK